MARGRYTPDGSKKLCKGRTHPEGGEFVNLRHFHVHKTGRLKGRPFYVCIPCWNVLRGKEPLSGQISWDEAWPVIQRLIDLCGSKAEVHRRLGVHSNWLYEIGRNQTIRRVHWHAAQDLIHEIEAELHLNRQGEAEVVRAEPLSTVLRSWVKEWLAQYPIDSAGGEHFMGPIQVLAEKTEINVRRVSGIVNGEFEFVSLSQADKLLTAAGLWDYISNGEIPVIPNPNWSMVKWQAYMDERGC